MSRIFISAAHKSSGKTTVSIGLCAALHRLNMKVQSFKKGPDYIDPYWLSQATHRPCYNLDFFTMEKDEITSLLTNRSSDADFTLIEGNKGLYDGLDLDGSNSNAALATLTRTPVILVLNARGMTRGIAPLILGYQAFDPEVSIRGVILNRLGGSRHESKLRNVIEHYTDVEVVGAIHNDSRFDIEERHLGLVPGHEDPFCDEKIRLLGDAITEQVNIDSLLHLAAQAAELKPTIEVTSSAHPAAAQDEAISIDANPGEVHLEEVNPTMVKLGLVRCSAFGFYYPDDLQALEQAGAQLIEIDPCHDESLPEIDALFIGGGFPETHMKQLEDNASLREEIRSAIDSGLPAYAECGGLMYLARSIEWNGERCNMIGSIDADIVMETRPQGRGYVQLQETEFSPWPEADNTEDDHARPAERIINAHEFHYSRLDNIGHIREKNVKFAYRVKRGTGIDGESDGYIYNNLLASYTHQRNTRNNPWAKRFINFARSHKQNKD